MNSAHSNLICPISNDYLEEPIVTPCCGNAISRHCLNEWFNTKSVKTCPICRKNINDFNVQSAPTLKNIMDLVNEAKNGPSVPSALFSDNDNKTTDEWSFTISRICPNNTSVIGKLVLTNNTKSSNFKTLLIPTIDKSGSMAGS